MGRRRHTPEQIITALREAEVGLATGKTVVEMSRKASASDPRTPSATAAIAETHWRLPQKPASQRSLLVPYVCPTRRNGHPQCG